MGWHSFTYVFIKNFVAIMAPIIKLTKKTNFSLDRGMLKGLGIDQIEVY
jgi:hypothetical protein